MCCSCLTPVLLLAVLAQRNASGKPCLYRLFGVALCTANLPAACPSLRWVFLSGALAAVTQQHRVVREHKHPAG